MHVNSNNQGPIDKKRPNARHEFFSRSEKVVMFVFALLIQPTVATEATQSNTISGVVILDGELPKPFEVDLQEEMQKVTGKKQLVIQRCRVGENNGLADCVVTLYPKDPKKRKSAAPLKPVTMIKDGPSFVPRVMVVTPKTKLEYRNINSPCKCFRLTGGKHNSNTLVGVGEKLDIKFEDRDTCRVQSNLRPYMVAWIHVVDTPYFALSGANGRFQIKDILPGEYRVRYWHESVGWIGGKKSRDVKIQNGSSQTLHLRIKPEVKK